MNETAYLFKGRTCRTKAWASHAESLGAKRVLSFDAFKQLVRDLLATDSLIFIYDDDRNDFTCPDRLRRWFSRDPKQFGNRIYQLTKNGSIERLGQAIQEGLDEGWLTFNPSLMEYQLPNHNNSNIDLTGLMWQIALTNWDATKADLSTPQVAMMARLSLQALDAAVFPPSFSEYNTGDVEKALNKTRLVVAELSARADAERSKGLPEAQ